ncbi:protein phosphatase 1 regulatory subunit 36 isoform X1 [Pelobates fuscus]|uniref:protein phosphatase 1 regulatory subunit 36 isoform X1 n=1 Tax=Pelobates fuscus TaxID=191477 RepID=UPI002FE43E4B
MDPIAKPVPGHWYWREDTNTLEFSSSNGAADARERARRARTIHFQEHETKAPDRVPTHSFNVMAGSKSSKTSFAGSITRSPKHTSKHDREHITLEDVKYVALSLLKEDGVYINSFSEAIRSQHLDEFLMALLSYLSCYLEKQAIERKPKPLLPNLNIVERKVMAAISSRTELALKHFAQTYCALVLGLELTHQHHMACGKSKGSTSKSDRMFYEFLYSFCIYVAWVVFRRKELSLIQTEIGRILRSNTFNPALRANHFPDPLSRVLSVEDKKLRKSTTYAPNRRDNPRRPAIKSIITQRSPLLASLMPTLKEQSQYLFQQHGLHPKGPSEPTDNLGIFFHPVIHQIGILGEPRKNFNPYTLVPLDTEEDEVAEIRPKKSTASFYSRSHSSRHSNGRPGTGRQSTVISRATTEAAYSDVDEVMSE